MDDLYVLGEDFHNYRDIQESVVTLPKGDTYKPSELIIGHIFTFSLKKGIDTVEEFLEEYNPNET